MMTSSSTAATLQWAKSSVSSPLFKKLIQFAFVAALHTSREPSPKIQVRMGVDNMVRMVKITATPSVVEEMNHSVVMGMTHDSELMKG